MHRKYHPSLTFHLLVRGLYKASQRIPNQIQIIIIIKIACHIRICLNNSDTKIFSIINNLYFKAKVNINIKAKLIFKDSFRSKGGFKIIIIQNKNSSNNKAVICNNNNSNHNSKINKITNRIYNNSNSFRLSNKVNNKFNKVLNNNLSLNNKIKIKIANNNNNNNNLFNKTHKTINNSILFISNNNLNKVASNKNFKIKKYKFNNKVLFLVLILVKISL